MTFSSTCFESEPSLAIFKATTTSLLFFSLPSPSHCTFLVLKSLACTASEILWAPVWSLFLGFYGKMFLGPPLRILFQAFQNRVLQNLLRLSDPVYASLLEQNSPLPFYALSNLLTLFAHDVPTLPLIQHVFDYLLCRPPISVVYLGAAVGVYTLLSKFVP